MQKACSHTYVLLQSGGAWFQGLFHSLRKGSFHLSLTVLVRCRSADRIQPWGVGPPDSDGVSRVPPYSGSRPARETVSRTGLSPSPARLSRRLRCRSRVFCRPSNPPGRVPGFGLLRVRSPLLAESRLISFPRGTEMFHFPRSRPRALFRSRAGRRAPPGGVAPFGDPRVTGRLRLAVEYRRLPRPSSPSAAKASAMRPNSLAAKTPRPRPGRPADAPARGATGE